MPWPSKAAALAIVLPWSICTTATGQGFSRRYDPIGSTGQFGWCIEQIGDDQFVVIGNMPWTDSLYYPSTVISFKLDPNGELIEEHQFQIPLKASYPGWSNSGVVLSDGRVVIGGGTQDLSDSNRVAIFWLGENSEPIDYLEIRPSAHHWIGYQLKATPDGGFILTGVTTATGVQDIFLLKTDSIGNVQWWQTYGHPTRLDFCATVDLAPDGGYFIGGLYQQIPGNGGQYVQWVLHADSLGGLLWEYFGGVPSYEAANAAVLATQDGNLVYAAALHGVGQNADDRPQLVKLDTGGTELWNRTYGGEFYGTGFFVVAEVPISGDLIACGQKWFTGLNVPPYRKGILLRATSEGDSLWMREYLYSDSTVVDCQGVFRDVQPTPDGGFIVVGEARGNINGSNPPGLSVDVWVVKVDSLGCIIPGCDDLSTPITEQITNLKEAVTVFPNPTSTSTVVKVTLPSGSALLGRGVGGEGELTLRLVSTQGQEVLVQKAVMGENALDLRALQAGLYYLHLTNGSTWLGGIKLVKQ